MFVTDLVLRSRRGTWDYVLDESLVWEHDTTIRVPMGYRTDLASVPRPLWALFPPSGRYRDAAVVHDYLLTNCPIPRYQADALFYHAMADLCISGWRRFSIWAGVRVFGVLTGVWHVIRR